MEQGGFAALRSALVRATIYLALALGVLAWRRDPLITRWYFENQDLAAGLALVVLWPLALWQKSRWPFAAAAPRFGVIVMVSAVLALLLWWGAHAVMLDYPLTRDEHMATFDAAIYASGRLAAPLPAQWAGYATALVPHFLLEVPGHALLVSAYGPVNAGLRAAFGMVADPALLSPLLAAVGLVLLHRIARRLFPDCPGAQWVAIIGYTLSAQIAITAMSAYAMTAHLALNLAWLALYLRDKAWSHALAMAIGCAAIGLHQVVFHPLFAGPFVLLLLAQRRWRLFAAYALVYAAALAFWLSWPQLVMAAGGVAGGGGTASGTGLGAKVLALLLNQRLGTVPLMLYNLLRAVTWSAAFVFPFILLALPAVRRREGLALPLAGGIVLTLAAMAILLPYQGHGWGYRYLHGVLGNGVLLSAYGYRELARANERLAGGAAAMLSLGTLAILAWLMATAHGFVTPYARLSALIARQPSDFAIVDSNGPGFAVDLVRNDPGLADRPLVFSSQHLTPAQVLELCARGSVTLFGPRELRSEPFLRFAETPNLAFDHQVAAIRNRPCVRPVVY